MSNAFIHIGPSTSTPIQQSAAALDEIITFMAGPSAPDVIAVQIPLTNDEVSLEVTEEYDVNLQIIGSPPNVVIGTHPVTTVNVLDEDRKLSGSRTLSIDVTFVSFLFSCDCWFWK